jgi:D-arabinose 1-dehydrogenase-like Zn-dependent alcohol dehydrogenase
VGPGVSAWEKGQRVGVGWHGGHCFKCDSCRAGDYMLCENAKICGITYDGGYQEYMVAEQEALALIPADKLGAHYYIDTNSENAVEALQKLGGARVILATAPNSKAISGLVDGLGHNGKLLIVAAAAEPIEVSPLQLIMGRKTIAGWPAGHAKDSEAALRFSALSGVLPMIETYPLEHVAEAYHQMINNRARFRVVLTMTG